MANTVDKILAVAEAEVGYCEKKSNSQLDSKTANAGSANYVKYWRDIAPNYQGQYWCDGFVDWCFYKAYGAKNAQVLECGGYGEFYTPTSAQCYKNKKQWGSTPKVGAQIFFKNSVRIHHTGLVKAYDNTYVYTYEGNTSNGTAVVANGGMVCVKKYKLTDSNIAGYGYPNYDKTTTTNAQTNTQTTTAVKVESAKSKDTSIAGSYKSTAKLNLRAGAGTNKTIITTMPAGKAVQCYGYYTTVSNVKWYLVKYNNYTGFVSSKYLKK